MSSPYTVALYRTGPDGRVLVASWATPRGGVWHDFHVEVPPGGNYTYEMVTSDPGSGGVSGVRMAVMSMKR